MSSRKDAAARSLENARNVDQEILRTITNMDILDALEELIEITRSTIAEGVEADFTGTAGSPTTTLEYPGVVTMPWKGYTLFNDGPSPVLYVATNRNYFDGEVPLRVGQPYHIDFGVKGGVKKIILTTKGPISGTVNGNASFRIFGLK